MLRKKGRLVSSRHSTKLTPQQLKERYLARAATKLGVLMSWGNVWKRTTSLSYFFVNSLSCGGAKPLHFNL